jgi:hypothetical protein
MIIELFVLRVLEIMNGHMTSHSVYEFLEVEKNGRDAMAAYEAIVMSNTL